ncbi:MAG: hypothetical protein AB7P02_15660 [Alphaproteobacteria bacterium]
MARASARGLLAALALAAAGCAPNTDLVISHVGDDVTVRIVDGDSGAAKRAADYACGVDRKRAVVAAVSADRIRYRCDRWH